ncbi:UDP-N-acetylmuramoyl-tripeptide--D-alanyl-D-alanine ligase [Streptantibioticus ferralitis]|uniref:UDP-N-acetylmuramoyl-tripeptide--D-alanyl-D-alanine ligase n=1 Tax=Streptantibioticus ferralitis TaxID=236510 RepID=A0ABT5Z1G1_9ACTN|nr:UDP-N-acetylmuramoyl-tripeptide--D-alanyl-D-alanine ligase [Streptantibioticus ferralitis]MDF2257660.1 UDP-N-acetylmuramoyl-tripeptide--D-alanyl-D-alanine ligase [Streptantibioticus ferralitis]
MLPIPLTRIADIVGGNLHDAPDPMAIVDAPAVFDSREAQPGSLFIALRGEQADGHAYAPDAIASGAAAALVTRPVGVPAIVVPDVLTALGRLAQHLVHQLNRTDVVAVTGSAGKTSTKDLIAHLLSDLAPTVATHQSFNNEIGLPVTISRATQSTRYLVLEMGARGIGHIRDLTRIARPQIAVVLNVGTAHVGEFGSRDNIAQAKGELVEALPPGGLAVLNADDDLVHTMATRTQARLVTFGQAPNSTIRAERVQLSDSGQPHFTLCTPEGAARVALQLVGEHHVSNAVAAAAVAREAGMRLDRIAARLATATPQSRWRMETTDRPDGVTVVNDAYNANPDSMAAALKALAAMARGGRRAIAVLGEMRELGQDTRSAHEEVGTLAGKLGLDLVITIGGKEARWLHDAVSAAGVSATHLADQGAARELLNASLRTGDVVLVKASRGAGLQTLAEALVQTDPSPAA